jgi:AcrR family transcriptional regulator|tara:strand:+ start:1173 stop:1766 length:594 start_codon:yes stop_codon:yes gene_type:complete
MARPRDTELDTKIIEGATDEFHAVGYGAMTLASIATRAGVRPGAVYTRFRDKPEVLDAILQHVALLRAGRETEPPGDDPYENLLHAVRNLHDAVSWEHAWTIPGLAIMGTTEADEVRDLIREDLRTNRQSGLLRPAIEAAIDAGVLPGHVSVDYATSMLLGAYFTFRLAVDAEHWPADMPEKLLATLGAQPSSSAGA